MKKRMEAFSKAFNEPFEREIRILLMQQRDASKEGVPLDEPLEQFVIDYIKGGKRIHPFLISLFSNTSLEEKEVLDACIGIELFHLAALLHDDIMDQSMSRRGVPTIHIAAQQFSKENPHLGTDIALLLGDMFLIASLEKIQKLSPPIFSEYVAMMQRTIRGQYLDSFGMNQRYGEISPAELYDRHLLKTAWYTFGSPAMIGIMLGKEPYSEEEKTTLLSVMNSLGLLFQVRDDIIDCIDETSGKELFTDIFENQTTWVTHYLKEHSPEVFVRLLEIKGTKDERLLKELMSEIDFAAPYQKEWEARKTLINESYSQDHPLHQTLTELLDLLTLR